MSVCMHPCRGALLAIVASSSQRESQEGEAQLISSKDLLKLFLIKFKSITMFIRNCTIRDVRFTLTSTVLVFHHLSLIIQNKIFIALRQKETTRLSKKLLHGLFKYISD